MNFFLFFEVLDKEPAIALVWSLFAAIGIFGFLLSFLHRYLAILGVLVSLCFTSLYLTEFWDPHINPSIWHEDRSYLPQVYLAMTLSILLPISGGILNYLKQRKRTVL